jgi:hypothetical protein
MYLLSSSMTEIYDSYVDKMPILQHMRFQADYWASGRTISVLHYACFANGFLEAELSV